ncbi:NADH dehydrogenase [ubiquinone] 1 alpha subcomplex subunit 7-like [Colletes gigas]|uniref:NADH dehydrogenase [ubiquinone] 1 alpha subcomplex subunit 7-like n=1 Tax=Colletes gigas TaxID=935657 RepID=UPI001C9A2D72|nr:NADH dehydrogenase [ubiquinone] 1 alpha subcomplex subunit 7-like [Colletes gigas]
MPRGVQHRSVTPAIQVLRNVLRGRSVVESLRHSDTIAARTQPDPLVPGGPNHKLSKVYYYSRDARRLVAPPEELFSCQRQIEHGKPTDIKYIAPGKVYAPDDK